MKICFGGTRVVLLFGNKAVKIGRIKPIRLTLRILLFPFMSKKRNDLYREVYGKKFFLSIVNYLLIGRNSNIIEYDYYQKTKDSRVTPTKRILLFGWIVVQDRGESVSMQKLRENNPFNDIPNFLFPEKNTPRQFCEIDGKLFLADYGRSGAVSILMETFLEA
ncbi:MAG: hypothetical protein WCG45_03040 [bacterium]